MLLSYLRFGSYAINLVMFTKLKVLALSLCALMFEHVCTQQASKNNGERISIDSMTCVGQPFVCTPKPIAAWVFSPEKASAMVIINHGSQGLDSRIFEYVDQLNNEGIAALVID